MDIIKCNNIFLVFLIARPCDNFLDSRKDKYQLGYKHLPFAYLFKTIKSLKVFIINGHAENIHKAIKYLDLYYGRSFINSTIGLRPESSNVNLSVHLESISEDNPWIEYTDSTQKIIDGFKEFDEKINLRVEEKIEIDVCLNVLERLLIYEYLQLEKVTKDQIDSMESDIETVSKQILLLAAELLNSLSIVEDSKEPDGSPRINKIENVVNGLLSFFNHKYILVTFFSWLILLSIIVVGLIYFGIKTTEIKLDSTVFIGAVSVIVLGAITLSATIYSKKKDTTTNKR